MATTSTATATSGTLDVTTLVSGLMTIARQPINTLNTKQTSVQAKISALGSIQSQMASFQTAVQALGSSSTSSLLANQATSSDPSISLTAGSTAVAGSYTVNVTSLAQSQKLVAAGQTSMTAAIGSGTSTTINFDFGTISGGKLAGGTYTGSTFTGNGSATKSITIDSSNNTLQGIRDAINTAGMGVTATIVNDGSNTPYRLALSSDNQGLANSLKISTSSGGDPSINSLLANDPAGVQNMSQTVAAQNAVFDVNGIPITKSSNSITDAIQGVTLNLTQVTTSPATLTVAHDTNAISTAVTGLVSAYNSLYTAMKNSSKYGSGSALSGDPTLRSLQTQMRGIAAQGVSGNPLTSIEGVGISFKADGTMQLDSTKLNTVLASNFSDVTNLFNGPNGYATNFNTMATSALASGTGAFATHTSSLNQSITNITNQIATLETRMTLLQKQYTTQYTALNVLLTNMGSTSIYLTQQLSRL